MSLVACIYYWGYRLLRGMYGRADLLWSGLCMGLLNTQGLEELDRLVYCHDQMYRQPDLLEDGLWEWEKSAIERYFPETGRIAVLGAGTGREYLSLANSRKDVDAFEAQAGLRETGNRLLAGKTHGLTIQPMPYNGFPETTCRYDGIVLGWGMLSGISGHNNRQSVLESCKLHLAKPGGVLLASFLMRAENGNQRDAPVIIANFLRRLLGKPLCERGDAILGGFIHRFRREEIIEEFHEAGFDVVEMRESPYPHILARPVAE